MRKLACTLLASIALVLFAAVPAHAIDGPHYWMYTDDGGFNGGKVDFWSRGDHVNLCDNDADGASVRLWVYKTVNGVMRFAYELRASGDGNCNHKDPSDGAQYDLPERCTKFQIWLVKDGHEVGGSWDDANWDNDNNVKANCNFGE